MMTSNCALGAYYTLRLPLHGNVGQCYLCGVSIAGFTWGWLQSRGDFLTVHFLYVQLTRSSKFVPLSHSTGRIPEVLDSLIHNIGDHEFQEISTSSWWVALAFWKHFWCRLAHGLCWWKDSLDSSEASTGSVEVLERGQLLLQWWT